MQKWFQKILLFLAVATIVGHSSLPHYHYEQIEAVAHHHNHEKDHEAQNHHQENDESKGEQHSIFSFAQLDETFVPANFQDFGIELPIVYLLTPVITYHHNLFREQSKTHFGFYKEYPPPDNYLSQLHPRGPPSLSNMA